MGALTLIWSLFGCGRVISLVYFRTGGMPEPGVGEYREVGDRSADGSFNRSDTATIPNPCAAFQRYTPYSTEME